MGSGAVFFCSPVPHPRRKGAPRLADSLGAPAAGAHAARTERGEDLVRPQSGVGSQGHDADRIRVILLPATWCSLVAARRPTMGAMMLDAA